MSRTASRISAFGMVVAAAVGVSPTLGQEIAAPLPATVRSASPSSQAAEFAKTPLSPGASNQQVQAVHFQQVPPVVGDRADQQIAVRMQMAMRIVQSGQVSHESTTDFGREQRRIIEVLETSDNKLRKARVTFLSSRNQTPTNPQPDQLTPQAVHGKTYIVSRDGERNNVTDNEGAIPPRDEYELVVEAMQSLGKPHPLAAILVGKQVLVGQRIELPEGVAEEMLGLAAQLGSVRRFELTLVRVEPGPEPTDSPRAVFAADIETDPNGHSPMALTMQGEIHLETETCRSISAQFSGPVQIAYQESSTQGPVEYSGGGDVQFAISASFAPMRR